MWTPPSAFGRKCLMSNSRTIWSFLVKLWQCWPILSKNISSLLILKHDVYLCAHTAISKYHSHFRDQVSKGPSFSHFHFFNFVTPYGVLRYSVNTHWEMKLIDHARNLIRWIYIKTVFVRKLHIRHVNKMIVSFIVTFYQGISLLQDSNEFHTWRLRFYEVCTFSL